MLQFSVFKVLLLKAFAYNEDNVLISVGEMFEPRFNNVLNA